MRAVSTGGTDLSKNSTDDSDWISISDAANGEVTIIIDKTPSEVPTTGEKYLVAGVVTDGTDQHRFGDGDEDDLAVWEFKAPPEGAWGF
ncbi:MAG: hypothetical protein GY946_01780 [bacterium]|nr:hypothetical protein [bacterium]